MSTICTTADYTTPQPLGPVVPFFPFLEAPSPDEYTRGVGRTFKQYPENYTPTLADRNSYSNLILQSQTLGTSPWSTSGSPARVAASYSSPFITLDLLGGNTNADFFLAPITISTSGAHVLTFFVSPGTILGNCLVQIYDDTTSMYRGQLTVNTTGSTPALSAATGMVLGSPIAVDGVWRVGLTTTALTAGNTHYIYIRPTDSGSAPANVKAGGFQLALTDGPYIATTTTTRTVSAPPVDHIANPTGTLVDPLSYQVGESAKSSNSIGNAVQFTKTYARIPSDQVTYGSLAITKPAISNFGTAGTAYTYVSGSRVGLDTPYTYSSAVWVNNQIYSGTDGTYSRAAASGGTFTLTYKASTTAALNWNDSGATIAAALNALASVSVESLTFSAVNNLNSGTLPQLALTLTAGATSTAVTMNAASLTPAGATIAFTYFISSTVMAIEIAGRALITAHGFNSSLNLIIYVNSEYHLLPPTSQWSVIDANNVAFHPHGQVTGSVTRIGQLIRSYTSGPGRVRIKRTSSFYLPGVTSGVTTAADIPIPSPRTSDAALLTLLASTATGFQDYDADSPKQWMGPIYELNSDEVDMATF